MKWSRAARWWPSSTAAHHLRCGGAAARRDRAGDRSGRPVRRLLHRPPRPGHRAHRRGHGRPAGLRPGAGLRGPQRPRRPAPRPVAGHRRRQARGQAPRTALALAGKSTLNRLELPPSAPSRYKKIACRRGDRTPLRDLFLQAHTPPPEQIVLDLDATDDPIHGHQHGRFFHGYYECYCYLPLYIFCGDHLLAASCGPPTSTPQPAPSSSWRGSWPRSGRAGRGSRS